MLWAARGKALLAMTLMVSGLAGTPAALGQPLVTEKSAAPTRCDFNGDGYAESLFLNPSAPVNGHLNAGELYVRYGSADGLPATSDETWSQDAPGIKGVAGLDDRFATAAACADFDGDGFDDIALGAPGEAVGGLVGAGIVHIIYGSASGLDAMRNRVLHQNSPGMKDSAEADDLFGSRLHSGDYNGDSYADLAIGAFLEDFGDPIMENAGVVHVVYGSVKGIAVKGNQLWHQDRRNIRGVAEESDWFGRGLDGGDFNGDGISDLVIRVELDDVGSATWAGAVNVIYGTPVGLRARGNQRWQQNSPGVKEHAEESDLFGRSSAVGDFNGDGFDDLAVGVKESRPGRSNDGLAHVIYGTADGLDAVNNQIWHQDRPGVKGQAEDGDDFAGRLAAGDFDDDGYDDLAVGVPGENLKNGAIPDAGAVNVLYGSGGGLDASRDDYWHQDIPGIRNRAAEGERFGAVVVTNDYNGDGYFDLLVGVGRPGGAAANVLYGGAAGLSPAGNQYIIFL